MFDDWLKNEVANGLIDLKLTVKPGATAEQIKSELLACEDAIANGRVRPAPSADSDGLR